MDKLTAEQIVQICQIRLRTNDIPYWAIAAMLKKYDNDTEKTIEKLKEVYDIKEEKK